ICDRVGILQKGVMIREGDITSLTSQKGTFLVGLAQGQTFPQEEAQKVGFQVSPRGEYWEIKLEDSQSIDVIIDLLRSRGLSLRNLLKKSQRLEELFSKTAGPAEPGVDGRRLRPSRADDRIRPPRSEDRIRPQPGSE